MKLFLASITSLLSLFNITASAQTTSSDWPQLQNGPQRKGYSSETMSNSTSHAWAFGFAQNNLGTTRGPERLYPQVQPVVAGGKLYIGTSNGTFYCFNAATGSINWTYPASRKVGSILGTAGVENGKVFFASMDGSVYALDASTGTLSWQFNSQSRAGFSGSVLLADSRVYVVNRAGIAYALNQSNGSVVWQKSIGVPVFMSTAYDSGKLFFGAMDMKVYALDTQNSGNILWSVQTQGQAYKDYWPVAFNGKVYIRASKVEEQNYDEPIGLSRVTGALPQSELDKQANSVIPSLTSNPKDQDLFILDQVSGALTIAPHYPSNTMNGAPCPPSVDKDGLLIMPVNWNSVWGSGWSRYNPTTNRITHILWDGSNPTGSGDESTCVSVANNVVYIFHTEEQNASFTGLYDLNTNSAKGIGNYNAEYYFWNNTQGGGTTPASISNGMIYHTTQNTLNARRGR